MTARDWRAALRDAPKPCSRRQGLDALLADAARPLPAHLAPVLVLDVFKLTMRAVFDATADATIFSV